MMSRKLIVLALLLAVLLAAVPRFSSAQDDGESVEEVDSNEYSEESEEAPVEQQMYVMPAPDVTTFVKFLGVDDNRFVAGNEVTALIGMTNAGEKTYNVSYVGAHLHSPYDVNFFVQNFTVRWTSNLLPPRSELTLEYRFRPDEKLEALDFHLSGWLIYNDSASVPIIYRSLFVNKTVEVLERRAEFSLQGAVTWTLVAAGIGIVAYVLMQQNGVATKLTKRARTVASEAGAAWEAPKVYKPAAVSKAVGGKKEVKPVSTKSGGKQ